jgi:nucleotide-binding universal stress UspA family protein
MSLKSILVHVTDSGQAKARVETALAMAMDHNAHLTGLGVNATSHIPPYAVPGIPAQVMADVEARGVAAVESARVDFEAAMKRAGWSERSNWLEGKGNVVDVVGLHARYADLTVIGQQGADGADNLTPDGLVLQSGRPVLVIPHVGVKRPVGKHIVVAWNASREAARAVGDAMPVLEHSEMVDIMSIKPEGIGDLPGADLARHLARHDIKAEAKQSLASQIETGDVLLNYVSDSGADLVVMGAYGHSRMREFILGGVTHHMLEHMTVPVLMSH